MQVLGMIEAKESENQLRFAFSPSVLQSQQWFALFCIFNHAAWPLFASQQAERWRERNKAKLTGFQALMSMDGFTSGPVSEGGGEIHLEDMKHN